MFKDPKDYINHRTNINHKIAAAKDVYIYEDHRTILNVLFLKQKEGDTTFPVDIFLFDNHDDACVPSKEAMKVISKFNKKRPSNKDFWGFVEFDLHGQDDDWVKAGMELNLVNNVFLFNSMESSIHFCENYRTKSFGNKRIYNLGKVWSALGYHGYLNDAIKFNEYGQLWNDIGWKHIEEKAKYDFVPINPFIVDFDLDCFATNIYEKLMAIPEEIIIAAFNQDLNPAYHYFYTAGQFVKELIEKSQFATMCFENQFCGGLRQAHKIFDTIDYLFFDEKLGKGFG